MKTIEKIKFITFQVTIVALVITGTIIVLPAESSSTVRILASGYYRPLSEWPGLVVPVTRLLTPLPLRQIYTDDYSDYHRDTSSSVTKPVTSYNKTKEPPSRFHHKHYKNKTKKPKNNNRKMKTRKKNFFVENKVRKGDIPHSPCICCSYKIIRFESAVIELLV